MGKIVALLLAAFAGGDELDDQQLDASPHQQFNRLMAKERIPGAFFLVFENEFAAALWLQQHSVTPVRSFSRGEIVYVEASDATAAQWSLENTSVSVVPNVRGKLAGVEGTAGGVFSPGLDRLDQRGPVTSSGDSTYSWSTTGNGVDVYVMDDAIDVVHSDFSALPYEPFAPRQVFNLSFGSPVSGRQTPHGTQMASLIGGVRGGVAKGVNLIGVDVGFDDGSELGVDLVAVMAGIDAVEARILMVHNPSVLNMSFSMPANTALDNRLTTLTDNTGVVVVAAAGNAAVNVSTVSPARAKSVLAVGATDPSFDAFFSYSNYGKKIGILAPGNGLYAAIAGSGGSYSYAPASTSSAAALVSGVAARYLETHPTAGWSAVQVAMKSGATIGAISGLPTDTANRLLFSDITSTRKNYSFLESTSGGDRVLAATWDNQTYYDGTLATAVGGEKDKKIVYCPLFSKNVYQSTGFVAYYVNGVRVWGYSIPVIPNACRNEYVRVTGVAEDVWAIYASVVVNALQTPARPSLPPIVTATYSYVYAFDKTTGAVLWTRQVGASDTTLTDVATLTNGNGVVAVGYTTESVFGTTLLGGVDGLMVWLAPSTGAVVSATSLGFNGTDKILTVATDQTSAANYNRVVVGGSTDVVVAWPGNWSLNAHDLNGGGAYPAGGTDAFVATVRAGTSLVVESIAQFGGSGDDALTALGENFLGFVAGNTKSSLGVARLGGGQQDAFWFAINPATLLIEAGEVIHQFGGPGNEDVSGLYSVDAARVSYPDHFGVFISGSTDSSLSFGVNPGGSDAFVTKYSAYGEFRWDWQSLSAGDDFGGQLVSPGQYHNGDGESPLMMVGSTNSTSWPQSGGGGGGDGYLLFLEGF